MDHVKDYRPPKDSDDIDDVTKSLREEGCAPRAPSPASSSSGEDEQYAIPVKKPKKGKNHFLLPVHRAVKLRAVSKLDSKMKRIKNVRSSMSYLYRLFVLLNYLSLKFNPTDSAFRKILIPPLTAPDKKEKKKKKKEKKVKKKAERESRALHSSSSPPLPPPAIRVKEEKEDAAYNKYNQSGAPAGQPNGQKARGNERFPGEEEWEREEDRRRNYREGERRRETDRDKDRKRETGREKDIERKRETDRDREYDRRREMDRDTDRRRETDREREDDRRRQTDRYKDNERRGETDRHRDNGRRK